MTDTPLSSLAVVTGGSRGIGKACAERLAREGYEVVLTYVSKPDEAATVADDIVQAGGRARAAMLNVGDEADVVRFFADEVKGRGHLGLLVNNAGLTHDGLILRMKDEQFLKVINVNLAGAFRCLREAAKIMGKQRAGRVVNIASVVGQMGNAGQANYVASKAGLIGLTKSAAKELAPRNITVNAVAPGFIDTDMTQTLPDEVREQYLSHIPLARFGSVADVAETVAFLAGDGAGYITGQVLGVNGGMYM